MFYHLLESSRRDDSNKWSNIGFGKEITKVESIKVHFTHLFWSSDPRSAFFPMFLIVFMVNTAQGVTNLFAVDAHWPQIS